MFFRFWLCCVALLGGVLLGCAPSAPGSTNNFTLELSPQASRAHQQGKALVLFAYDPAIEQTEAYADWAYYLNEFASENQNGFFFQRLEPDALAEIGAPYSEYTLFIKSDGGAFLVEGLILEPQVYSAMKAHYARDGDLGFAGESALSDSDRAFMPDPVVVEVVTGSP